MPASGHNPASAKRMFQQAHRQLDVRDVQGALSQFDAAQAVGYPENECAAGRWQCWMLLGQFQQAWQESQRIADSRQADRDQLWSGESWRDRRLMLRCLHGLGDTIQFIRYVQLLREQCQWLAVQTHPELVRLVQCVKGPDAVFSWPVDNDKEPGPWDLQMEVTQLPFAFRTTLETISQTTPQSPYISIPQHAIENAGAQIDLKSRRPKVGLVWNSGPFDASRNVPTELVASLFELDCDFYSLQKGVPFPTLFSERVIDLLAHIQDVLDTAAYMKQLDLVITVDTMTAHLAGALNVPVWIMLPAKADWRWMLKRTDSPWYPTARLFRQSEHNTWQPVIEQIQHELPVWSMQSALGCVRL